MHAGVTRAKTHRGRGIVAKFVYGYKVHIMIDSASGLPMMLTVTTAAYGENRTVSWFVRMVVLQLSGRVSKFLADAGYDGNGTRLQIILRLEAAPFIPLNTRNASGSTIEEKKARRRKELCLKFYTKNFIRYFWTDPDSEEFDREFDARTFSEQGFSVGKGSLNLDSLKHVGIGGSHCILFVYMHDDVAGGKNGCRNWKARPEEVCKMLPGLVIHSPLY